MRTYHNYIAGAWTQSVSGRTFENRNPANRDEIIGLFQRLHDEGQTIVIVTHEEDIAGYAQRIVRLCDGRIISDHPTDEDPIHQEYLNRAVLAGAHGVVAVGVAVAAGRRRGVAALDPVLCVLVAAHGVILRGG